MSGSAKLPYMAMWWLWALLAAALWLFWLLSVPVFLQRAMAGTLPAEVVNGASSAELAAAGAAAWGASIANWALINTVVSGLVFFVFSSVALLIWWRVRTGFGLLTAYVLLGGGSNYMNMAIYGADLSAVGIAVWELGALVWPLFFVWLYLFADGRAVPRQLLWIFVPLITLFTLGFLGNALVVSLDLAPPFAARFEELQPLFEALSLMLFIVVFAAQVFRYVRVSGPMQRNQAKWFIAGLAIAVFPAILLETVLNLPPELGTIAFAALPLGIGVSILRYRLWDIDVIIRKTVVYAVLTGLLVLVYLGAVLLLQNLFSVVAGEQTPLIIVASTLLIAALFAPLRRRIQEVLDRRFFRKKYNAQQVLADFAQAARDETDLVTLTAVLRQTVQETVQPQVLTVWFNNTQVD